MHMHTHLYSFTDSLTPPLPSSLTHSFSPPFLTHSLLLPSLPHSLSFSPPFLTHSLLLPSLPHSLTPSPLPTSLTHSFPPPFLTHSLLLPSLPHSLTPPLPSSLTHSFPPPSSLTHSFSPPFLTHSLLLPSLPHSLTPSPLPSSLTHSLTHTILQYVPNEYAIQMAVDFPNLFIPFGSVNPYRSDALEELERCAQCGVKVIKWLVSRRSCHGVGQISGFHTEEMGSLGFPSSIAFS